VNTKRHLPRRAQLFITAVLLGGGAAIASRIPQITRWSSKDLLAWAGLALTVAVAEQFLIPLRHGTERQLFSLTDALWVAGLLLTRASVLTASVAAGVLIGQAVRRLPLYKVAFNAAQYVLAVSAAEVIHTALHAPALPATMAWVDAGIAMAAYFAVNAGLVAAVISLVQGRSAVPVLLVPLGFNLLNWAGNVGVGLMASLLWTTNKAGLPILVAPAVLTFLAYRAWVQGLELRQGAAVIAS
jgi:hypothetical protein